MKNMDWTVVKEIEPDIRLNETLPIDLETDKLTNCSQTVSAPKTNKCSETGSLVSETRSSVSESLIPPETLKNPPSPILFSDAKETSLEAINSLKATLEQQTLSLRTILDQQSKILKDITILRFDQEAIIKSMVTEGKKLELDKRPGGKDLLKVKSEVSSLSNTGINAFAFQRDLNWLIRSGKPSPFVAEHSRGIPFNFNK